MFDGNISPLLKQIDFARSSISPIDVSDNIKISPAEETLFYHLLEPKLYFGGVLLSVVFL